MPIRNFLLFVVLGLGSALATLAPDCQSQSRAQDRDPRLQKIMNGLEAGIAALRELGLKEEAAHLLEVARGARKRYVGKRRQQGRKRDTGPETERKRRAKRNDDERAVARRQLQVFRFAKAVYTEMGNKKAVEMIDRVMHAREYAVSGRRDREAKQAMERSPSVGNQVELLNYAAMVADKKRPTDRGASMRELAKQLAGGQKKNKKKTKTKKKAKRREQGQKKNKERREKARKAPKTEVEIVKHRIEVLQFAAKVLTEADREKGAKTLSHAARALEFALKNLRNEKAMHLRRTAPTSLVQAEWLGFVANLLKQRGRKEQAAMVSELAGNLAQRSRRQGKETNRGRQQRPERKSAERESGRRKERDARANASQRALIERIKIMEKQINEIREMIKRLRRRDL